MIRRAIIPMIIITTAAPAAHANNNPINFPVGKGVTDGGGGEVGSERTTIKNNDRSIIDYKSAYIYDQIFY